MSLLKRLKQGEALGHKDKLRQGMKIAKTSIDRTGQKNVYGKTIRGTVLVASYTRKDGTRVKGTTRKRPTRK